MSHQWEQALVAQDQSIRKALQVINEEALRVALVVDHSRRLLGVISDGDVRRAILKEVPLSESVSEVMNSSPITASSAASREELVDLMKANSILAVPIVQDGKVIGLETLHSALNGRGYDNPIFLMAGGFGTRLRPLTDDCPKPMLKVGEKPILETLITNFVKAGFTNFYISTHYMPEVIQEYFGDGSKYGAKICYVHEDEPLGTGGALGLLPDDLPDLPVIMINGDVLTNMDFKSLLDFHESEDALATMCVREYESRVPFGVVFGEENRITDMIEKPVHRFLVNAGIYTVSPELIRSMPKYHKIDMPTFLKQQIDLDKNILMFPVHEYWLDIGRMDDFKKAQQDIGVVFS